MSDDNFIARWSRRKRETAAQKDKARGQSAIPVEPHGAPEPTEAVSQKADPNRPGAAEPEFDLSSLPPLEEITAGTDIRAFLQSGVPAELTKAALRRAWTSDPAIRDFIGLAENQWDFTDPSSIPGFGPLGPADDVRRLVDGAMGRLEQVARPTPPNTGDALQQRDVLAESTPIDREVCVQTPAEEGENKHYSTNHEQVEDRPIATPAASQNVDESTHPQTNPKNRSHGDALPQ